MRIPPRFAGTLNVGEYQLKPTDFGGYTVERGTKVWHFEDLTEALGFLGRTVSV